VTKEEKLATAPPGRMFPDGNMVVALWKHANEDCMLVLSPDGALRQFVLRPFAETWYWTPDER
jgi:hypothetical protein